jgi:hypothetical protein
VDSGEGLEEDESSSESDSELVSGTATLDFPIDRDGVIDREVDVSQADEVDLAISTSTSVDFLIFGSVATVNTFNYGLLESLNAFG